MMMKHNNRERIGGGDGDNDKMDRCCILFGTSGVRCSE